MSTTDPNAVDQPMTAIVEFRIPADEMSMADWLSLWTGRADDARDGEPETSAYEAAVSIDNGADVLVFERYRHGDPSLLLHMERPSHAALARSLGEHKVSMSRTLIAKFVDLPDFGWWSRPERDPIFTEPGAVMIVIGMNFSDDNAKDAFVRLSAQHAAYCWDAEPDTLVYSAGRSVADANYGIDVEADLIFVMCYTNMAAAEKHREDPRHIALGEQLEKNGIAPPVAFSRLYTTSGCGYLWNESDPD